MVGPEEKNPSRTGKREAAAAEIGEEIGGIPICKFADPAGSHVISIKTCPKDVIIPQIRSISLDLPFEASREKKRRQT